MDVINQLMRFNFVFFDLFCVFLVMFTIAGLTLFNAGMVRSKNTIDIFVKSLLVLAIGTWIYVTDWYFLTHVPLNNFLATTIYPLMKNDFNMRLGFECIIGAMPLAAVVGATAERLKLWAFAWFAILWMIFLFPILWWFSHSHVEWLSHFGFFAQKSNAVLYFAGSASALAGMLCVGSRIDAYSKQSFLPLRPANVPLMMIGFMLCWIGSLGLIVGTKINSFDQFTQLLSMPTELIFSWLRIVAVVASSLLSVFILLRLFCEKTDLTLLLNAGMAAWIALAAFNGQPSLSFVMGLGVITGVLVMLSIILMQRCRVDDVTGLFSCFLIGAFVGFLGNAFVDTPEIAPAFWLNYVTYMRLGLQLLGSLFVFSIFFLGSVVIFGLVRFLVGLRPLHEVEFSGLDTAEYGLSAYPEFSADYKD